MRSIRDALYAYRLAHQLIWKGKVWRVMVIPILLTMIYMPLVITSGWTMGAAFSAWVVDLFPWLGDYSGWVYWPMRVLVFLVFALFGYFTFRIVAVLLYMPFLEFVAERVERKVLGRANEDPKRWYEMIGRMLLVAFVTVMLTAALMMLNLAASLIPIVGTLAAMLCVLPLQFFLTGFGYIDPYFDRSGYSVSESLRRQSGRFGTIVLFDLLGTAILLIPIVGWFIGPTYSVVAGVVLGIRLQEQETGQEKEKEKEKEEGEALEGGLIPG